MNANTKIKEITDDAGLKSAFKELNPIQHRIVGALFVQNVLPLTNDERVKRAIEKAQDPLTENDELSDMFSSIKRAMIDSSTRCGADADWDEQASHFVIRAANTVVTPNAQKDTANSMWQVAQSCRMARSCSLIASADDSENPESETQYQIVNKFLENNS